MSDSALIPVDQSDVALTRAQAEFLPFAHHDEWVTVKPEEQGRIRELLELFSAIEHDERGTVAALNEAARQNLGRHGWSFSTLRTLYYAWIESRDWRAIVHGYRHESKLPGPFVEELQRMVLHEHRSRFQAMRRIREQWAEGKPVPGYGTWREWFARTYPEREVPSHFCGDYPAGWSKSTIYDRMPSRAQHAFATRGFAAAKAIVGGMIRDTSELRPLEFIVFDDFETDIRVRAYNPVLKEWEICRCAGLLAQDVSTRRVLATGLLPRLRLPRKDGELEEADANRLRKITASRADLQFLLKVIFTRFGIGRDYPMTLLVENAAAAITPDFEQALNLLFGGQVRVCRIGVIKNKTLANGFAQSGGKPWEHGWVESLFNLMHNRAGNLPGQKGSSERENGPADLAKKILYAEGVLKDVTEEQAVQLRIPFLSIAEAVDAYNVIFDWMARRQDHKMLGFAQVVEWRLGPGDKPKAIEQLGLLAPEEQERVELLPPRLESPIERWQRLTAKCAFMKVPEFVTALLTYTPKSKICLRNGAVSFRHGDVAYSYLDVGGDLKRLPQGTPLMGYFDPAAPAHLYVTDLQGRALGILTSRPHARINNAAEIDAAAETLAKFFHNQVQAPVRELLAGDDAQLADDRAHNEALRSEWGLANPPSSAERTAKENRVENSEAGNRPRVNSLSRTLAQNTFAEPEAGRFAAAAEQAQAIATHAEAVQERAQRDDQVRRDAEQLTDEEIAAATERPAAPADSGEISAEEITDIFRTDNP